MASIPFRDVMSSLLCGGVSPEHSVLNWKVCTGDEMGGLEKEQTGKEDGGLFSGTHQNTAKWKA